jgi:hypothetical protein
MRLEFSISPDDTPGQSAVSTQTLAHVDIDLADLSYEEIQLLSDRLVGNLVCRLEYGPTPTDERGKRKPGRPKRPRGVRVGSPPVTLQAKTPTLLALLTAVRENETEVTEALHQDLRKRFRALHNEERLEADKRVVVLDRKFKTVLEYEDPQLALDVYVRLIGAAVVSRKDLAILEWTENGWVKLDPAALEASPRVWQNSINLSAG